MKKSTTKVDKVRSVFVGIFIFASISSGTFSNALATESLTQKESHHTNNELKRRANWQAKFSTIKLNTSGNIGKKINQLSSNSPLAQAGLKTDDVITDVNNKKIDTNEDWYDITDALVAEEVVQITYLRKEKRLITNVTFPAVAKENYSHLITYYQSILNPQGLRQRIIITKPQSDSPQPAIFIVQGLSCASVELLPARQSNYSRLLKTIVTQSNMVVMRVEKPGLGDSEGNCSQTDFITELAGYELALKTLKALPYVDSERILIYGNSMGSAIAPYLANKYQANAVIADGTFFRTWFEHMLEIERRIKQMQGLTESEINQQMNLAYIPLYYGMLVDKKSYQQLTEENPELAKYNYHGPHHMYGRSMSYYYQLQEFDVAGAWQKLTVPTRIRWGTNDWIMSEADNDMIVNVLSTNNVNVELSKYPGLDHWSTIHTSAKNSFIGKPGIWHEEVGRQIINWANEINLR